MSTTESGRIVHWATGLQHQKQKSHGLRASLRFSLRPWLQDSRESGIIVGVMSIIQLKYSQIVTPFTPIIVKVFSREL